MRSVLPARLAAAVLLTLLAAAPASARELMIFDDATHDHFLPAPGGGAEDPGAQILWNSPLTTEAGEALGSSAGQCVRVDAAGAYLCSTVFYLADGAIVMVGRQEVEPDPSLWVVTGGSGAYRGATGEATAVPVEDRARFRYSITLAD